MGELRWHKRDHDAALAGMACLSLEERGAYNTVLDLIYSTGGNLKDDDHYIAHWLDCDVRIWRRIRRRLIDLEKLYLHGGKLRNARADKEIDKALDRIASARQAGIASGLKREEQRKNINDIRATTVQRLFERSTSTKKITSF